MSLSETVSSPPRVLIADDDPRTARALTFLLQRHRYSVELAADGRTALDILTGPNPPNLALLDWEMPRLDGLHVVRALRSLRAERYTYLLMITARDEPQDIITAFEAGVDDFLSKPVDSAQLVARMRVGERVLALEKRLAARVSELEHTLNQLRHLKALLPICMYCKKVRDDSDYWHEIDAYIYQHTGTDFSHGLCPTCAARVVAGEMPTDPAKRRAE